LNEDADSSKIASVKKCPFCGGELEKGYVVAPRSLAWDKVKPRLRQDFWGGPGSRDSELLTPSLQFRTATFPAARCRECHVILFEYKSTGVSAHL